MGLVFYGVIFIRNNADLSLEKLDLFKCSLNFSR